MNMKPNEFKLETIELHITDACSQHCPYCYLDAKQIGNDIRHGDFDILCGIIERLGESNVTSISVLGGDPVLHPMFLELIKFIRKHRMNVIVMSNSMHVNKDDLAEVAKYIDEIATTIHGKNEYEHDEFTSCPGAYYKLIENLRCFSTYGVPIDIAINIIPDNFADLFAMIANIVHAGVKVRNLLTQRILCYGRASNTTRWMTTSEQVNVAFEQAVRCTEEFGIGFRVEDPYPFCEINPKFHKYMHGCPEGVDRVAMNMDGFFSRCGADPNYSTYNIFETSLQEVWYHSNLFSEFRSGSYLLDECKACKYLKLCRGGCPIDCIQCNTAKINYIKVFRNGINISTLRKFE